MASTEVSSVTIRLTRRETERGQFVNVSVETDKLPKAGLGAVPDEKSGAILALKTLGLWEESEGSEK